MWALKTKRIHSLYNRSQIYKEEQKELKPQSFTGQGKVLEDVQSQTMEVKDLPPPTVDKAKEVTKVNIRLHTGKSVQMEVNMDSKVQIIYDYVARYLLS